MAFFRLRLPGVRVKVGARGVRVGVGPRIARAHVGTRSVGVSSGLGPLGAYIGTGGRRRRRPPRSTSGSRGVGAPARRTNRSAEVSRSTSTSWRPATSRYYRPGEWAAVNTVRVPRRPAGTAASVSLSPPGTNGPVGPAPDETTARALSNRPDERAGAPPEHRGGVVRAVVIAVLLFFGWTVAFIAVVVNVFPASRGTESGWESLVTVVYLGGLLAGAAVALSRGRRVWRARHGT